MAPESDSYREIQVSSILRRSSIPDWIFCNRYSASPYRACSHGCAYCDGRAEKYYVEGNFQRDIEVRTGFISCLKRELPLIRERGIFEFGSGVSDVYQGIEKDLGLMRQAAKLLVQTTIPVVVLTKSSLVERDLDLWIEKGRNDGFLLMMSLVTLDDSLRRVMEPGAPSVEERLKTLSRFKSAGLPVGIFAMPLLPGLGDDIKSFRALVKRVKNCGADFIIPSHLTLRPGRQKEYFLDVVRKQYPSVLSSLIPLYHEQRSSGNTVKYYRDNFYNRLLPILKQENIPGLIPHKLYRQWVNLCDETVLLLFHIEHLYPPAGGAKERLLVSRKRFLEWLNGERKVYNRRRSLDRDHLDRVLMWMFDNGEMKKLLQNDRLFDFLKEIVIQRKILDYTELKLI